MTEQKVFEEINPFVEACDKMVSSKFIMIDKRISDVLKSIAKSGPVFNFIKECMVNFNFDKEWKFATSKMGCMLPPEEPHRFVAFVFSLLNCIDDKKISASDLLSKCFSKIENEAGPYAEFCETLIVKFKNIVVAKLLNQAEPEVVVETKSSEFVSANKDVLARLEFLAKDLKEYVQGLKKVKKSSLTKGELLEVINGLLLAIKNQDVCYIKSYVIAIKAGKGKDKELNFRLVEILEIVSKSFIDAQ